MNTPYLADRGDTYLLLTSSLTSLVAAFIDACLVAGSNLVVITDNERTQREIEGNVGVTTFLVPISHKNDNKSFFFNSMPGSLEDEKFQAFPIWKGLSIDRLRFWQVDSSLLKELIEKIDYTKIAIDLDPMSALTSILSEFDDTPMIVLKNTTLRTPEIASFLRERSRLQVVTSSTNDIAFLYQYGIKDVKVWEQERSFEPPIDKKRAGQLVYYDKQYIWQFNEFVEKFGAIQPVSFDERSTEVFRTCHPHIKATVLPPSAKPKPVELIMFAYDENIANEIDPEKITLFDPYGVNMTQQLSVGDKRVEFVDV